MSPVAIAGKPVTDPRAEAFCSPAGPEVFSGIVHGNQIWTLDPFDVEAVHGEAREEFTRLLHRASADELPPHGKTLLLLGEAGSGKTHLMRAFRTAAHAAGDGFCGYLQMRVRTDSYARYVLSNLISSLEQPYQPGHAGTGLNRLARGLLDALDVIPAEDRQTLCDSILEPGPLADVIHRFADIAVQYPKFREIDINVIRAVLYTLPNDGRIRPRVLNWLRCEDLGRYDRELIGDLVPRPQPEKPMETIISLGRLMHAVHTAAFVLLVDQIDETFDPHSVSEPQGEQFRQAVGTLLQVADSLPNAVVVIGCLEDLFTKGRESLPNWARDRLEYDPDPIRLPGKFTHSLIAALIGRRLEVFYDDAGLGIDPTNPTAPFTANDLARFDGLQTRVILGHCLQHRAACIAAGQPVPFKHTGPKPDPDPETHDWKERWNDHLAAFKSPILDDEPALADLLAFAVRTASAELPGGIHTSADLDGRFVEVVVHGPGNAADKMYMAVCDKGTQGGGLGKQIAEVAKRVGDIPAVLVRSTAFPNSPSTVVVKEIVKLIAPRGKGRKVVVENSDWRAMAAFRAFHAQHHPATGFADWQMADRPLSALRAVHAILDIGNRVTAVPPPPTSPPPPAGLPKAVAPPPPPAPQPTTPAVIRLGDTRGSLPIPVEFVPAEFRRHAAFLGGSGSGKTTAALTIIEQLLLAGVPAVLIDRKGDLARYAEPAAWTDPEPDPDRAARRSRLRAAIDIALYTPGNGNGRPVAIPLVPPDLASLPAADREQLAQYAAVGLGLMMGYKSKAPDPKVVILQKAIELLARRPGVAVTLSAVRRLVADQDDALVGESDSYPAKYYEKLAENLQTLRAMHGRLLEDGDPLDIDALLGRGTGKTRLTILNTQFLGDAGTTDFWVSQFLLAVDRWRAKNPAGDGVLQAVILFDEADLYLPAVGKPATKGPMESLLKRARSAGIGIFLATQSPGDFDYKCRDNVQTWLVGQVKEAVAIGKLKPVLSARPDATGKLPSQTAGQFYLAREGDVAAIRADRNLVPTVQLPEDRILVAARLRDRPGPA